MEDKYYEAIMYIVENAESLRKAVGISPMSIFEDLRSQMYGLRQVAIMDRDLDQEMYDDIVDKTTDIIREWRNWAYENSYK